MRLLVVLVMLGVFGLAPVLYRRWKLMVPASHPRLPATLVDGADRTWVLFTTPYCASCGPVEAQLRVSDPTARVVKVDATREPALASAFSVRSAPTVLLSNRNGEVKARLVGPEAVSRYVKA